jgi:hypothetical protein
MSPEALFASANAIALVAWVALVFAPRWRWTVRLTGVAVPALFALTYVVVLATHWSIQADSFSTLTNVAALFENPWALLAGWVHYLAFDLLVGGWVARDAASRGVPHLLVVPCLVLTFLFGPAGWLAYQAVKGARVRGYDGAPSHPRTS